MDRGVPDQSLGDESLIVEGKSNGENRRGDILDAVRTVRDEPPLRGTAQNPDLRTGRVQMFHVMAIDLSELVADQTVGMRFLQASRATDGLFQSLKNALVGTVDGCALQDAAIRERMARARGQGGKAVWTDQFVDRHAPIRLPCRSDLSRDNMDIPPQQPIDSSGSSGLGAVRFLDHKLQMFRDGTICYTVRTELVDRTNSNVAPPPASAIIEILAALDLVVEANFRAVLADFLRASVTRKQLGIALSGPSEVPVELSEISDIERIDLRRRGTNHTAIFVECFYDGEAINTLYSSETYRGDRDSSALVGLHTVLTSSTLPGILNTATWYQRYNSRYVRSLARKEIGYRDDEIYLTDRKATVAVNPKFWDEEDSLSLYKYDIVLAIEYNLSRLSYFGSILQYYQSHPDVRGLDRMAPALALESAVAGQALLLLIEESLDLTLLIDHGFTRLFTKRLHEELGFQEAIGFIRKRVDDASSVVGLRSSVLAAEHTSKDSLAAALENNNIQNATRRIALWAVLVAIAIAGVTVFLNVQLGSRSDEVKLNGRYCVVDDRSGISLAQCPTETTSTTEPG